jgi:hypothetical protein
MSLGKGDSPLGCSFFLLLDVHFDVALTFGVDVRFDPYAGPANLSWRHS